MHAIKRLSITLFLLLAWSSVGAAALRSGDEIMLWDDALAAPSNDQAAAAHPTTAAPPDALNNNLTGIVHPSLVAFVPEKPNSVSVVVVPGGSYLKLVAAKEGVDVARWLNSIGITAFVLKHRLPNEGHADGRHVVLQDGQRAIRLVRQHASEWQLNAAKIGIMGFSAGGHLAAATGTAFAQASYPARDAADALSARPDFVALIYPAVGFPAAHGNTRVPENQAAFGEYATDEPVSADVPPAFMMVAADDGLARRNVRYWQVLQQAGNAPELHVVAVGGHGFALKPDAAPSVRVWPALFSTWLHATGIVAP